MIKKPTETDCKVTIGVKPYSDDSGFRYAVVASADPEDARISIFGSGDNVIEFPSYEDWENLRNTVERAFKATEDVGDDR